MSLKKCVLTTDKHLFNLREELKQMQNMFKILKNKIVALHNSENKNICGRKHYCYNKMLENVSNYKYF